MPRYDFKCKKCQKIKVDVILPITHVETDRPKCCGEISSVHISVPPMVHWVDPMIEPFRAIATKDRPVITTAKQNREYMARHDLVDANEVVGKPPSKAEQMQYHNDVVLPSIKNVSATDRQLDDMKKAGIKDPLTQLQE